MLKVGFAQERKPVENLVEAMSSGREHAGDRRHAAETKDWPCATDFTATINSFAIRFLKT
jgi:hypothetical protein